jgi:phage replication-related protein YjqB (UPF0714/DUF867 family)
VEVLSSRVLLRPVDFDRSEAFYRTALDLPVYREFGDGQARGIVFFLGIGFLELSGHASHPPPDNIGLWLQVRDVRATHETLKGAGVTIVRPPQREPWGLDEMWIADPDGVRIAVIEVPPRPPAPAPVSFAELLAHPGVEEEVRLAGPVGLLAFHGGLEGGTAELARDAADAADASLYTVVQPPTLRWHIPSHLVEPAASAGLRSVLDHVHWVIAVHGYGRPGRPTDILVGGGSVPFRAHVAEHLRRQLEEFSVVDDLAAVPAEMRGLNPANPVNLAAGGGVQLELPPRARGASPRPADRGLPCRPVAGLVTALAAAVRSWPAKAAGPAGAATKTGAPQHVVPRPRRSSG